MQNRDRYKFGVLKGPGSAVHHSRFALALHRVRDKPYAALGSASLACA